MKRKLMTLLLCLAAAALFLSVSAAEDNENPETLVPINGMTTEELSNALNTLVANRLYLTGDYTLDPAPASGILDCTTFNIIDLNGYTLDLGSTSLQISSNLFLTDTSAAGTGKLTGSGGGGSNYVVIVKSGLTIEGSVTISGKTHGISVNGDGRVTISANVDAPTSAVYNKGGTVLLNEGGRVTTTSGGSADIAIYNDGGKVSVEGGSVATTGCAVYNKSGTLDVKSGGVATTGRTAVYTEGGTVTVEGGSVSAKDKEALSNKGGKVTVSAGTITSGAEPAIALTGADNDAELTMSGGTVTQTGEGVAILLSEKAKAVISGGTVSAPYTGGPDGDGGIGLCLDSENCELTLSGGAIEAYCCGIYSNDPANVIRLSGNPAFSTGNAANADIELVEWNDNRITIAAPLTYADRTISVRLCGDENDPGVFTSGYSSHHPHDDPSAFFSTKGGAVVLADGEAKIENEAHGITLVYEEEEGAAYAYIYGDGIEEAYTGSTVRLAAEPEGGYGFARWEAVEPDGLVITDDQFTMPDCDTVIRAVFMPAYAVGTDTNTAAGVIYSDGSREEVSEAIADDILDIWLRDDAMSEEGYYFTGAFTVDGEPLGSEPGYGYIDYFTMPDHPVEVGAIQEAQTELTLGFGTNPVGVPEDAYDMIAGPADSFMIDIDESGADDIELYYDDEAGECLALLLPECDAPAGTYLYDSYDGPFDPYSSIRFEIPERPKIAGYALRLGGVLGLRCYVELPEGYESDPGYTGARMTFSMPNREAQEFLLSEAQDETVEGKAYKRFEYSVYAYQMADEISAVFSYGDGLEVSDSTTLEEYLNEVCEGSGYSDQAKALAAAAVNYGHYIQPYLARVNGWTYGVTYAPLSAHGTVDAAAAASGAAAYGYTLDRMEEAVTSAQYRLTLNADTIMTIKIRLADAPEETVAVKVDGAAVTPAVSGTEYTVVISDIAANNLGAGKTVTMEIGGTEVFSITVSPMSYVNDVLRTGSEEDEQNAMAALYEYYRAAYAYSMQ